MFLLILHKAKSLVSKFKNLKSVIFEKEISLGILRLNGGEKKKSNPFREKLSGSSRAQVPRTMDVEESTRGHAHKELTKTSST